MAPARKQGRKTSPSQLTWGYDRSTQQQKEKQIPRVAGDDKYCFVALGFVVEEKEGDVVLLADGGLIGIGGDLGAEVVGELARRDGVMRMDVMHDSVEAVLFTGGVAGFRETVSVKNVTIAGFERDFECGVLSVVNHS